jgi:hypothetical protein
VNKTFCDVREGGLQIREVWMRTFEGVYSTISLSVKSNCQVEVYDSWQAQTYTGRSERMLTTLAIHLYHSSHLTFLQLDIFLRQLE